MNRWFLPIFLLAACLISSESVATKPFSSSALDPVLFQKLATNSIEDFALLPIPTDRKVNYALALAGFWVERQNPSNARFYFNFSIETAKNNGMKKEEGKGWFGLAVLADISGDLPSSLDRISKAVNLFKESGEKKLLGQSLFFLANQQHRRGMYADSLRTYTEIQTMVGGSNGELLKAECLSEIALLNYKMGHTNAVTINAQAALKIFETNHNSKGEADCLKILGNQAGAEGRNGDAINFYEQAAVKYKESGNIHGQANCFYNIGVTLADSKEYNKSIISFQEAVGAYTRSASVTGVGIANKELGRTYYLIGDFPKAEAALDMAKSLLTKSQDLCRLAETEGCLADLKVAQGNKQGAITHHKAAIQLYEQAGLSDLAEKAKKRLQKAQTL